VDVAAGAEVEEALDAAEGVAPVAWADPKPPARAAIASARAAGIAKHTRQACRATSKSAHSVAHRWSANADERMPDPGAAGGLPAASGAWLRSMETG
jgi:hypothetical protein